MKRAITVQPIDYEDYFTNLDNFLNRDAEAHCCHCGGAAPSWAIEQDEIGWRCLWCGEIGDGSKKSDRP